MVCMVGGGGGGGICEHVLEVMRKTFNEVGTVCVCYICLNTASLFNTFLNCCFILCTLRSR